MRINLFVLALISLLLLAGCSQQETLKKTEDLVIPTFEYILENGYPVNDKGETYGPGMGNMMIIDEPDLILAQGENSIIGYVKKVEMDVPKPKTPEEAVKLNNPPPREVTLYDIDGETIIGTFWIGK
ncbi:metal ABC transporter substrate-binding protein [Solibacillus isronensis]|uniref:metal ABC transporter substrate-binding protein n=1 Tax=Solibacillus isronensis TaxID=412383 RepID=UPI00399F3FAF